MPEYNDISVHPVCSTRMLNDFIRFPYSLYRGNPSFVAHLFWERKEFFNADKNPLFEFTDVQYFLAKDNRDKTIGRITAHINNRHNQYWNENAGCFGFFESVPSIDVARQLFTHAERWLRNQDVDVIRGPLNFSTNEECGMLVQGYDSPPAIMMPYSKRYYPPMLDTLGYEKAKDLIAFDYQYQGAIPPYLVRFNQRIRERIGARIRKLDMDHFAEEIETALRIYNNAWQDNWGFVPMTDQQFRHMASELRPIIDPEIALIAEIDNEPVGFSLSLPDYNQILRKLRGSLFPFGWAHLLLGRRHIDRVRVITLGVVEEYRNRGIDALLYHDTFANGTRKGYLSSEMSWILEDNDMMVRAMRRMGAQPYKKYRIYEKTI